MFNNPVKPDSRQDEGTVLQVDPVRQVCKVQTMSGQKLDSVQWLQPVGGNDRAGDRVSPRLGDRVLLNHGLGYPLIVGFLARTQTGSMSYPLSIDSGEELLDTGNYSPGRTSLKADASRPADSLLGDRILASQGGGLIGLLRAGSLVLRSSRAAEVFLSRLGDLVRVTSRNFEHFTDLGTDVYRNFRGRVYRYFGVSNQFSTAKNEAYQYHQYYGDTAAAEAVKGKYHSVVGGVPATNSVIFKEQVTTTSNSSQGSEVMRRTVSLDGTEEVVITGGGGFTRMRATGGVITLSFGDQNTVTIDGGKINIHHGGGADALMNSSGVTLTFGGGKVEMSSSGVNTTFGGHFCNVTGGGVELG